MECSIAETYRLDLLLAFPLLPHPLPSRRPPRRKQQNVRFIIFPPLPPLLFHLLQSDLPTISLLSKIFAQEEVALLSILHPGGPGDEGIFGGISGGGGMGCGGGSGRVSRGGGE